MFQHNWCFKNNINKQINILYLTFYNKYLVDINKSEFISDKIIHFKINYINFYKEVLLLLNHSEIKLSQRRDAKLIRNIRTNMLKDFKLINNKELIF
jgi:hypothetical protein